MLKNGTTILLLFSSLFCSVGSAANLDSMVILQGEELICSGDFNSLIRETEKIGPNEDGYVLAKLTSLAAPSELENVLKRFEDMRTSGVSSMSEIDRLVFASALIRKNSENYSLLADLLNFHSANVVVEAYRKYHQSKIEYNAQPTQSIDKVIQAFYDLPYIDPSLLHQIFLLGLRDKQPMLVLSQFFPYIDKIPENTPAHDLLLADKNFLLFRISKNDLDLSLVERAYRQCKYNIDIALFYSSILMIKKMNSEAEQVFKALVEKYPDYPVYVDLSLAKIYFFQGDSKNGDFYLQRASKKKDLLQKDNQKELEDLNVSRNEKYNLHMILLGAIALLSCLLYFLFRKPLSNKNK